VGSGGASLTALLFNVPSFVRARLSFCRLTRRSTLPA
jgi:hypothetical protein